MQVFDLFFVMHLGLFWHYFSIVAVISGKRCIFASRIVKQITKDLW